VRSRTYLVDIGGVHVFTGLDDVYRYWSFVEIHPAHVVLTRPSTQEAADALHWSYTDRLLAHPQPGGMTATHQTTQWCGVHSTLSCRF